MHRIEVTIFYLLPSGKYEVKVISVIGTGAELRKLVRDFKATLPEGTLVLYTKVFYIDAIIGLN